jgi:hypothetical protein
VRPTSDVMAALIMYHARGVHTERDDVGDFFG